MSTKAKGIELGAYFVFNTLETVEHDCSVSAGNIVNTGIESG